MLGGCGPQDVGWSTIRVVQVMKVVSVSRSVCREHGGYVGIFTFNLHALHLLNAHPYYFSLTSATHYFSWLCSNYYCLFVSLFDHGKSFQVTQVNQYPKRQHRAYLVVNWKTAYNLSMATSWALQQRSFHTVTLPQSLDMLGVATIIRLSPSGSTRMDIWEPTKTT